VGGRFNLPEKTPGLVMDVCVVKALAAVLRWFQRLAKGSVNP